MPTHTNRLASALEVTFWLILLLLVGAVQPATQDLHSALPDNAFSANSFTPAVRLRNLGPQYLHKPPLQHRPTGEWLPADQFLQ